MPYDETGAEIRPKITDLAKGKWKSILVALGFDPRYLDGKSHHCPVSGEGKDRFRFSNHRGRGNFFCACNPHGKGDAFNLIECKLGLNFKAAAIEVEKVVGDVAGDEADERDNEAARADLRMIQSKLLPDRPMVEAYLKSRGLPGPYPAALRQANVWYGLKRQNVMKSMDAMVAKFVTPDGAPCTFHLTYLKDGKKADIPHARIVATPAVPMAGGAVRLFPMSDDGVLGASEGIETALAAHAMDGVPVWATLNASMLEQFKPPKECRKLIIYGDNDKSFTGHAASYLLAKRAATQYKIPDVEVRIPRPRERIDFDWNDNLQEAGR